MTSACLLFCVVTRGVERILTLPWRSSAVIAMSMPNAPLRAERQARGVDAASRAEALCSAPVRPPSSPGSGTCSAADARQSAVLACPPKPHWTPSRPCERQRVVSTMRASISTCGWARRAW